MALLEMQDLKTFFTTKRGVVKAVNGVSYKVEAGRTLGVVGESGSGKSVSAMSMLQLLDGNGYIAGGSIMFDGRDLTKLSLGTYFAQVSEVLSQEDMPNPELQSLLLNCLYALSRLDLPESQVKAVFELRAACLSGYTPDLTGCHVCGSQTPERFDLSAGMLECRNCRSPESNGIRMPVPPSVLEAMRYICYCDSKKLFSFQAGEDTLQQLSEVTEAYLATQLERGFSTLDFYKSLLI